MKSVLRSNYQLLFLSVLGIALFSLVAPVRASALEASAQTIQVIPPGNGTGSCAPIAASGFNAYVYEGTLHSFEFSVPDASYVALMGSIGDTGIPFYLMTRRIDMNGVLTIHVDVQSTPVDGSLPLQVTLLSARTGQPVCLGVVSIDVGTIPQPLAPYSPAEHAAPTPVYALAPKPAPDTVSTPLPTTEEEIVLPPAAETVVAASSIQNPLRDICTTEVGAYRMWLILLVLFTLLVGGALWAEFPMALPWARTPERIATIILALLLALLAFWYLSVSCRAALWMPLLAFFIAILGLLAAFWNHPRVTQLLLVEDSKTIKLPAAK